MNEDMKVICEVKDKVLDLLHKANQTGEFSMGDMAFLSEAMSAIKDACKVERMMEEDDDGYSSANRGKHYVRGHYSRDGGMIRNGDSRNGDYSSRRDGRGRYSRDDGRSEMMEYIEMAIDAADGQDKETLKRFMRQLENA